MSKNNAFFKALESLGEENSVETDLLIEKVKSAMLKAAKRAYPHSEERIRVEIDPKTKKPTRVHYGVVKGKKVRLAKSGESLD